MPVDELIVLILEDLPPVRVSAPDSHVSVSTVVGDIEGLVVVSSSDCQGLLVEVPDLGSSAIWNLDDHVPVVDKVEISVVWKLRYNVEVSLYIKTESFIELSFSWLTLPFINVDNVPLLMDFIGLFVDCNISILLINLSLYLNDLSSFVDNGRSLISENLPPS
jgi:hypothetical protein